MLPGGLPRRLGVPSDCERGIWVIIVTDDGAVLSLLSNATVFCTEDEEDGFGLIFDLVRGTVEEDDDDEGGNENGKEGEEEEEVDDFINST